MHGKEQYSEGSPTVGALRFPVQQYQWMPGSARIDQNPASQQPQAPSPKQQTQTPPHPIYNRHLNNSEWLMEKSHMELVSSVASCLSLWPIVLWKIEEGNQYNSK